MANTKNNNSKVGKGDGKLVQWRQNSFTTHGVSWSDIDAELLRSTIDAATRAGAAVMFGITSDGGAYSLVALYNSEKSKEYAHTAPEAEEALIALRDWFLELLV